MWLLRLRNKMRIKVLNWSLLNFFMLNVHRSMSMKGRRSYLMMRLRWMMSLRLRWRIRLKIVMWMWRLMSYWHRKISNNVDNRDRNLLNLRIYRMINDLIIDRWLKCPWVWGDRLNITFRWLIVDIDIFSLRDKICSKVNGRELLSVNLMIPILVVFIFWFWSHLVHLEYRLKYRRYLNIVIVSIVSNNGLRFFKPHLVILIVFLSLVKIYELCFRFFTFVRVVYHHL